MEEETALQMLGKILIVDDEEDFLFSMRDILISAGYEVIVADTGMKALRLVEKENLDVVLTDIVMPDLSGFQLARRIRQLKGDNLPIITITGYPLREDVEGLLDEEDENEAGDKEAAHEGIALGKSTFLGFETGFFRRRSKEKAPSRAPSSQTSPRGVPETKVGHGPLANFSFTKPLQVTDLLSALSICLANR